MSGGPKTPRASGTFQIWFDATEGLAGRLERRSRELLDAGHGDAAGEARWLAGEARRLGEQALGWAHRPPTDAQRTAEMAEIVALQRRAEEFLT